jgi:hypothetical protein
MTTTKFTIKTLNQDGARYLSTNGAWVGSRKNAREFSTENSARIVATKLQEEEISIVRDAPYIDGKFNREIL